jgi:alkylation response protein AidB-like acyl-CoA dehydrogenase
MDGGAAELVGRARELGPLLTAHAGWQDRERRLAEPVVEALTEAGFFRMLVPRRLGGLEVEPTALVRVVEELSAADGSVGWCVAASPTSTPQPRVRR